MLLLESELEADGSVETLQQYYNIDMCLQALTYLHSYFYRQ